jgi:TldD protein
MKDLLMRALDTARVRGATYADVRFVSTELQRVSVKNRRVEAVTSDMARGFGVRVIANGGWGFASSSRIDVREMDTLAATAVRIAKASSSVLREPVSIGDPVKVVASYRTPVKKDPFAVPVEERIAVLLRATDEMMKIKSIAVADGDIEITRTEKLFASSEGSYIEQTICDTGCGIAATAVGEGDVQNRTYPNSVGRHQGTEGWEFVERWDLPGNARRIAEEASALLTARPCPSGVMTVILDGSQTGLQVHESCGHPVELDRVFGAEAAYAGTSFLTPDKLGRFQYGSPVVNLTADATLPGGLGTFGYDDEGVPAQRTDIVKDGLFVGYLTSRETAARLGQPSNGTARASSFDRIPLIRMTNVNLEPGPWRLADLIADTDQGIYMQTNRSWSIDDKRLNFQFGTEIAWEIKGGKLGAMLKNATYTGMTPRFWAGCDAVCGGSEWIVWGTPNCSKGQPEQVGKVGHGAAPARFRNVQVGVLR